MNEAKGSGRTRIFIAWSGNRSKAVAAALREWIPMIIQSTEPWMSEHDIESGMRWNRELDRALGESRFGIVCLTPENLANVYIHFEAGAVAKAVQDAESARVIPYRLDLTEAQVTGPLSDFQMERAEHAGTLNVVQSINASIHPSPLAAPALDSLFEALWPNLEKKITAARILPGAVPARRDDREMIPEILERVRELERHVKDTYSIQRPSALQRAMSETFNKDLRNALAHDSDLSSEEVNGQLLEALEKRFEKERRRRRAAHPLPEKDGPNKPPGFEATL